MNLFKFVLCIFLFITHSTLFAVLAEGKQWEQKEESLRSDSPVVVPSHPLKKEEIDRYERQAFSWIYNLNESRDTIRDKVYELLSDSLNNIIDSLSDPELPKEAKDQIQENGRSIFTDFVQKELFKKYIYSSWSASIRGRGAQLYARELAFKLAETGLLQESYQELVLGMALDTMIRHNKVIPATRPARLTTAKVAEGSMTVSQAGQNQTLGTALEVMAGSVISKDQANSSSIFIPVPADIKHWLSSVRYPSGYKEKEGEARNKLFQELNHINAVLDSPLYSDKEKQALRTFYSESLFTNQSDLYIEGFHHHEHTSYSKLARKILLRLDSMGLWTLDKEVYKIPVSVGNRASSKALEQFKALERYSPIMIPSHPLTTEEIDRYRNQTSVLLLNLEGTPEITDRAYELLNTSLKNIASALDSPELPKEAKDQIRENGQAIFIHSVQEELFKKYIYGHESVDRRAQLYARELAFKLAETGLLQESYQELVLGMTLDAIIREGQVSSATRPAWLTTIQWAEIGQTVYQAGRQNFPETELGVMISSVLNRMIKANPSSAFIPVPADIRSWMQSTSNDTEQKDRITDRIIDKASYLFKRSQARSKLFRELNHIKSVLDSPLYSDAEKQALRTFYSEALFSHQYDLYIEGFHNYQITPQSRLAREVLRRLDSMGLYTLDQDFYQIPKSFKQAIQQKWTEVKGQLIHRADTTNMPSLGSVDDFSYNQRQNYSENLTTYVLNLLERFSSDRQDFQVQSSLEAKQNLDKIVDYINQYNNYRSTFLIETFITALFHPNEQVRLNSAIFLSDMRQNPLVEEILLKRLSFILETQTSGSAFIDKISAMLPNNNKQRRFLNYALSALANMPSAPDHIELQNQLFDIVSQAFKQKDTAMFELSVKALLNVNSRYLNLDVHLANMFALSFDHINSSSGWDKISTHNYRHLLNILISTLRKIQPISEIAYETLVRFKWMASHKEDIVDTLNNLRMLLDNKEREMLASQSTEGKGGFKHKLAEGSELFRISPASFEYVEQQVERIFRLAEYPVHNLEHHKALITTDLNSFEAGQFLLHSLKSSDNRIRFLAMNIAKEISVNETNVIDFFNNPTNDHKGRAQHRRLAMELWYLIDPENQRLKTMLETAVSDPNFQDIDSIKKQARNLLAKGIKPSSLMKGAEAKQPQDITGSNCRKAFQ